jgi:putative Holliday junction resolvase
MRILGLDMGDVWVGTALSDPMGIICRPLQTVKLKELYTFLDTTIPHYSIAEAVVGIPLAQDGSDSPQAVKIRAAYKELCARYRKVNWYLLDEHLTSVAALEHQRDVKKQKRSAQSKQESHSIAAAYLLKDFLASR